MNLIHLFFKTRKFCSNPKKARWVDRALFSEKYVKRRQSSYVVCAIVVNHRIVSINDISCSSLHNWAFLNPIPSQLEYIVVLYYNIITNKFCRSSAKNIDELIFMLSFVGKMCSFGSSPGKELRQVSALCGSPDVALMMDHPHHTYMPCLDWDTLTSRSNTLVEFPAYLENGI